EDALALVVADAARALVFGKQKLVHAGRARRTIERDLRAAQQRLAEGPQLQKIHILLALDQISGLDWFRRQIERVGRVGFAQVLQPVALRVRREFAEPYGIVDGRQIVVKQAIVALLQERLGFRMIELRQQAPRFADAL